MPNTIVASSVSPFDSIKQVRPDGTEYWSARDLQELMGYTRWGQFEGSIERAMASAKNQGLQVEKNFRFAPKVSGTRGPSQKDYELTRMAGYLVSLNGDPRKKEVAAAQAYFVVNTLENEIIPVAGTPGLEVVQGEMIALKPLCESIGIEFSSQRRKLENSEWATVAVTATVGADGKTREMFAVHKDHAPMWLATIPVSRLKNEEAKRTLITYQKEAAKALNDYFTKGVAVNPRLRKVEEAKALTKHEEATQEIELLGTLAKTFPLTTEWAQRQAEATTKKAIGMTSELPEEERLITAQTFLLESGYKKRKVEGKKTPMFMNDATGHVVSDSVFGRKVAETFRKEYLEEPLERVDETTGRRMKFYKHSEHRHIFEQTLAEMISHRLSNSTK